MNFALMFALALGIDYALFVVHRFRGALFGSRPRRATPSAMTMDTAGKAVLFSRRYRADLALGGDARPSPAFRSMALGIMLSVVFVLAATLTLLPAVLAKLGPRVDQLALPWVHSGEHRSPRFAAWGELLWRRPWLFGSLGARGAARPRAAGRWACTPACPRSRSSRSGDSSRVGYAQVQQAFGPGAPGALQIVGPAEAVSARAIARPTPASRASRPPQPGASGLALLEAVPAPTRPSRAVGNTIDRLRAELPAGALVGGAAAENHDLEPELSARTPLVIGVVLALGFLLLLVALQAPLIAAAGVLTNLLATGAAFGVARLVFQDGHGAGLLGFESQGFLDAWGPVFFFAMIFAISMDYTVFLLSSAKEHFDRTGDPHDAMVGGSPTPAA